MKYWQLKEISPQMELAKLVRADMNVLLEPDPLIYYDDSSKSAQLELQQKKLKDPSIRQVIRSINSNHENITYANHDLRKNAKHKVILRNGVL